MLSLDFIFSFQASSAISLFSLNCSYSVPDLVLAFCWRLEEGFVSTCLLKRTPSADQQPVRGGVITQDMPKLSKYRLIRAQLLGQNLSTFWKHKRPWATLSVRSGAGHFWRSVTRSNQLVYGLRPCKESFTSGDIFSVQFSFPSTSQEAKCPPLLQQAQQRKELSRVLKRPVSASCN